MEDGGEGARAATADEEGEGARGARGAVDAAEGEGEVEVLWVFGVLVSMKS